MIRRRNPWNYKQYNAENNIQTGEDYTDIPSLTVQDATMTLKELIARHRAGAEVPILDMQYDDNVQLFNENFPDITGMSKPEIAQLLLDTKEFIINQRETLQKFNNEKGYNTVPNDDDTNAGDGGSDVEGNS